MVYEDLRSTMVSRHEYVLSLLEQIEDLKRNIKRQDGEIDRLQNIVQKKDEEMVLQKEVTKEAKKDLSDEIIRHAITTQDLEKTNKNVKELR